MRIKLPYSGLLLYGGLFAMLLFLSWAWNSRTKRPPQLSKGGKVELLPSPKHTVPQWKINRARTECNKRWLQLSMAYMKRRLSGRLRNRHGVATEREWEFHWRLHTLAQQLDDFEREWAPLLPMIEEPGKHVENLLPMIEEPGKHVENLNASLRQDQRLRELRTNPEKAIEELKSKYLSKVEALHRAAEKWAKRKIERMGMPQSDDPK